jgi:hypothetical protein
LVAQAVLDHVQAVRVELVALRAHHHPRVLVAQAGLDHVQVALAALLVRRLRAVGSTAMALAIEVHQGPRVLAGRQPAVVHKPLVTDQTKSFPA